MMMREVKTKEKSLTLCKIKMERETTTIMKVFSFTSFELTTKADLNEISHEIHE